MNKIKVLFIDDDVALGHVVVLALNNSGYEAYYQTSLTSVKSIICDLQPDIIILDVEIGNKDGIEVTPEIKVIAPETPILFVSSHIESSRVVDALSAGGVAYLKKPFEIEELLAYIGRYTSSFRIKDIHIGSIQLDIKENILIKDEKIIKKLTPFECKLLKLLILNQNKAVTREQLELELWENNYSNEQSLNNYIAKLRKYLSVDKSILLETLPKIGYKLVVRNNP